MFIVPPGSPADAAQEAQALRATLNAPGRDVLTARADLTRLIEASPTPSTPNW